VPFSYHGTVDKVPCNCSPLPLLIYSQGTGGFTKKGSNGNLKKKKKAGGVTVAKKAPPAVLKKAPSGKITPTNGEHLNTEIDDDIYLAI
jgi:hypothetical protein